MQLKLKNNGDTIVEVLIAVAVLMVVITGGYSIATRSLNGARIAQERSEATMLAQGQLEAINQRVGQAESLSVLANGSVPTLPTSVNRGSFIGVDESSTPPQDKSDFTGAPFNLDSGMIYSYGFCVNPVDGHSGEDTPTSTPCTVGLYKIKVTTKLEPISSDKKYIVYNVNISWDKSGGGATEQINLVGRFVIKI